MATHDEELGKRIEAARLALGMSQDDLAKHMTSRGYDFTRQTVYKIEKNKRRVLAAELVAFADVFGKPVVELLGLGSSRAPLLMAGARLEEALRNLQTASNAYADAVMSYARAADDAADLHAQDAQYAREILARQTPAWISSASADYVKANLRRFSADTGDYANGVLKAYESDYNHFHGDHDG